jgi:glycogen synthase
MAYGGEAAVYAAIAQAIKASGAIVRVEPEHFLTLLSKVKDPLVVTARGGFIKANHQYLTGYKGLVFFTKSSTPLILPGSAEVVASKQIWIPG